MTTSLGQKTIDRYRKLRRLATHPGGDLNERLTAQKRIFRMEQEHPHISGLADRDEKREELSEAFVKPPQPPPDASWLTKKVANLASWAIDQLQEAQVEVLLNEAIKQPLSLSEQLEGGVDVEVADFEADDGEKCVKVSFALPVGLWQKIVTHQPFHREFVAFLDGLVKD